MTAPWINESIIINVLSITMVGLVPFNGTLDGAKEIYNRWSEGYVPSVWMNATFLGRCFLIPLP